MFENFPTLTSAIQHKGGTAAFFWVCYDKQCRAATLAVLCRYPEGGLWCVGCRLQCIHWQAAFWREIL